jgi:hypothetical protein
MPMADHRYRNRHHPFREHIKAAGGNGNTFDSGRRHDSSASYLLALVTAKENKVNNPQVQEPSGNS